ncbi:MAG: flavodoxin family protein [Eubacterium sp.]
MKLILHDLDPSVFNTLFPQLESNVHVIGKEKPLKNCIGCFSCWVKTPGACILKDSYDNLGAVLSKCDEFKIISACTYGGFSPFVKNIMDRSIPYLLPYFQIKNGEMHHQQRYDIPFSLSVYFYGNDITLDEINTAKKLIIANSINFDCSKHSVQFFKTPQEIKGDLI